MFQEAGGRLLQYMLVRELGWDPFHLPKDKLHLVQEEVRVAVKQKNTCKLEGNVATGSLKSVGECA